MKTVTIGNKRYRVELCQQHNRLVIRGPGLLIGVYLPAGVTMNSPDLRRHAEEAIARDRDAKQAAREVVQPLCRNCRQNRAAFASELCHFCASLLNERTPPPGR